MIDILKNNLKEFNIDNPNNNTIICDACEIEHSILLNSLSPIQKSNIHLNVNIYTDKDIESFIYLEQNGKYKSINIILNSNFNLSKTACKKLEMLASINSVFNHTLDNKIKGGSFKNYIIATAVTINSDTNELLSNEALFSIKNFSNKKSNKIIFDSINKISKEILIFFKSKNYDEISFKISNTTLSFEINTLFTIIERINIYTYSININIENNLKFNIIYKKIFKDIKNDYKNFLQTQKENENIENSTYYLYKNLANCGYSLIFYQTLLNLDINATLNPSTLTDSNLERYYLQLKLDKYWFNLDIIWNYENLETELILKNDKEFSKSHIFNNEDLNNCTISYKRFNKKQNLFKLIKNKFFAFFGKNKKDVLGLPAPENKTIELNKEKSIFQNI